MRAFGGLTTAEIARAWFVPEATMAQRISRAKARIRATGTQFTMPPPEERADRLRAVLHVLYLVFNEGYVATSGRELHRSELTDEAIRLTRTLHASLPDEGEVAGLLALMLLTDARRPARTTPDGSLVPLADQDRALWSQPMIAAGTELISRHAGSWPGRAVPAPGGDRRRPRRGRHRRMPPTGPRSSPCTRSWNGCRRDPRSPSTARSRWPWCTVPCPRSRCSARSQADERMAGNHRVDAVRAHLLEMAGDPAGAREAYLAAARLTQSLPEQRYLIDRAARLVVRTGD